jgi:hypothetical protein
VAKKASEIIHHRSAEDVDDPILNSLDRLISLGSARPPQCDSNHFAVMRIAYRDFFTAQKRPSQILTRTLARGLRSTRKSAR